MKATVADPDGEATLGTGLSWATVATNCLSQRLGVETATIIEETVAPKFDPRIVTVCGDATRCAAETRDTVGNAGVRAMNGSGLKSGK